VALKLIKTYSINLEKMRKIVYVLLIWLMTGCGLIQQMDHMGNFADCEFAMESIADLRLADMSVMNDKGEVSFSLTDMLGISRILASGTAPLKMKLNLLVTNPNPVEARMNRLEWVLFADTVEFARGVSSQTILLSPNGGKALMPIDVSIDLLTVFSGQGVSDIIQYMMSFSSSGSEETKEHSLYVKLKPSFLVGDKTIPYPGYFKVKL